MRKTCIVVAVFVVLLAFSGTALADGEVFEDAETGVQFTVPEGWTEQTPEEKMSYMAQMEEDGVYHQIIFGYVDLWDQASEADKVGYTRSDIDNSILNETDFTAEPGVESVSTVTYNQIEYFKVSMHQTKTVGTLSGTVHLTMLVYIQDAIEYMFMYGSTSTAASRYASFEVMMRSVKYPAPLEAAESTVQVPYHTYSSSTSDTYSGSGGELNLGTIILSLIITIAVYSLPIIIYRYGIRKRPVSPGKAKKITIIWAIVGFILISLIVATLSGGSAVATGGGIFLWSYVNYRMLKSGWEEEEAETALAERKTALRNETVTDLQGRVLYQGTTYQGCFDGQGTLYTPRGAIIYSGMFSQGFLNEPSVNHDVRIYDFKQTCGTPAMQKVLSDAQAGAGTHVRLRGCVFIVEGCQYPGECVFLMYFEGIRQRDAIINVRYQMRKNESSIPVGDDVIVWGSVDEMITSNLAGNDGALVPSVSAWYVGEASEG